MGQTITGIQRHEEKWDKKDIVTEEVNIWGKE